MDELLEMGESANCPLHAIYPKSSGLGGESNAGGHFPTYTPSPQYGQTYRATHATLMNAACMARACRSLVLARLVGKDPLGHYFRLHCVRDHAHAIGIARIEYDKRVVHC
jgi:hypothetical protein